MHVVAKLPDALTKLQDGDLLLFRGRGLVARLIQAAGRSPYSHAAMIGWWHGVPMCLEIREFRGGRAVTLESQVRAFPGCIDVFGLRAQFVGEFNRVAAVRQMVLRAGQQYGWWKIAWASLLHLPAIRLAVRPDVNDICEPGDAPQFCSEAVASASRFAGFDPVPNASDRITEPGDLARSILWEYRFTLGGP